MKYEINSSVFNIILKSLKITWDNFGKLFKLLLYPVFGQFLGIIICFVPLIIGKIANLTFAPLLLVTLFGLAVGLTIFCHAFWKYLLCQGAIIQMSKKILNGSGCGSLENELESFSRRSNDYIKYLLIMCLVGILAAVPAGIAAFAAMNLAGGKEAITNIVYAISRNSIPDTQIIIPAITGLLIFVLVLGLIGILFAVSLQTFVLNPMLSPTETIKKSIALVKNNYFKTIGATIGAMIFMALVGILLEGCLGFVLIAAPAEVSKFVTELVSNLFASFFTTPFYLIFLTWWYLKISPVEKK